MLITTTDSAIRIANLAELAMASDQLDWQSFRDGVEIRWLYQDTPSGASAALLRYQPGAAVPTHRHDDLEHIFILDGEQCDDNGRYGVGALVINRPGSVHRVWSDSGCIVLVIWNRAVSFL